MITIRGHSPAAVAAVVLLAACGEAAVPAPPKTPNGESTTAMPTDSGPHAVPQPSTPSTPATAPPATSSTTATPSPPPPPGTWTLQEKEYWVRLEEEKDDALKSTNEGCGTKMTGAWQHESFRGHLTEGGSYGLSAYVRSSCQSTFSAVRTVCTRGDFQKKAVASKVKRVECKYGAPGKTQVELRTGTLVITIDPDAGGSTADDETTKYLMKTL